MGSELILDTRVRSSYWIAGLLLVVLLAVLPPSSVSASSLLIDNADVNYTETGSWTTSGLIGNYGGDSRYSNKGSGSSKARFTPTISAAGNYGVYVWYPAHSNRATNAPFRIFYSGGAATYAIDQTVNGSQWVYLDTVAFVTGVSGYVELFNAANGYVGADAVL
jgi:hyaluronate lyase